MTCRWKLTQYSALAATLDIDMRPCLLNPRDPIHDVLPIHVQKVWKSVGSKKIESKQTYGQTDRQTDGRWTDATDCFIFPANAVGSDASSDCTKYGMAVCLIGRFHVETRALCATVLYE